MHCPTSGSLKNLQISAVITKADGRKIDLGAISHQNPIIHFGLQLKLLWLKLRGVI